MCRCTANNISDIFHKCHLSSSLKCLPSVLFIFLICHIAILVLTWQGIIVAPLYANSLYCAVACVYLSQIFVIFIVANSVVTFYISAENCLRCMQQQLTYFMVFVPSKLS